MIRLKCPHCTKPLRVEDRLAGEVSGCPACRKRFRVPQPAKAAASRPNSAARPQGPAFVQRPPPREAPVRTPEEQGFVLLDEDDEEAETPKPKRKKKRSGWKVFLDVLLSIVSLGITLWQESKRRKREEE